MIRVAVFGASSLVGLTVIERLLKKPEYEIRPVIHSPGNAWGLIRQGLPLMQADMADPTQLAQAIDGYTHVINCALPQPTKLIRNLLDVCLHQKVDRVVNLSCVAVYGIEPGAECAHEDAPLKSPRTSYGTDKLKQDRILEKYVSKGLSCANLCPPAIIGCRSDYLTEIIQHLRNGTLALIDEGNRPINLVHVTNLAAAIELALCAQSVDGKRTFITDAEPTKWADLVRELMPLADGADPPRSIPEELARGLCAKRETSVSLKKIVQSIIANPEIKAQMKKNPGIRFIHRTLKSGQQLLPGRILDSLKGSGISMAKSNDNPWRTANTCFIEQQLQNVRHLTDKAEKQLNYQPETGFAEGMDLFRQWYRNYTGYGDEYWALHRELHRTMTSRNLVTH